MNRRLATALAALALLVPLAGCVEQDTDRASAPPAAAPPSSAASSGPSDPGRSTAGLLPLRRGEHRMTLTMPEEYTPAAPTGVGTDDYRCFLLDPGVDRDVWLTGTHVLPGNPDVVHHVILFRVRPDQVAEAEAKDAQTAAEGWTCFGGTGLAGDLQRIDDAPWLGAWAPGGRESRARDGYGARLEAGSRIVMQVHYNLLKGQQPDRSAAQLRWMDGRRDLTPLHTFLLPAPVELPCRPGHDASPLCDRDAAVADVAQRFGAAAANTNSLLHLLCGTGVEPSRTTSCVRTISRGMTVLGVAGHMHLLGRTISIEANPGKPDARTILDIPVWDFDDQGATPIPPLHLDPYDQVKVTCTHQQRLRDVLPAFEGQPDRYIVWAEGSTDEMCLGTLQVAFDDES